MAQEFERRFLLDAEPEWLAGRRLVSVGSGLEAEIVPGAGPGGLVARVVFPSEQAGREFLPPGWLGKEVTGEERDASQRLSSASMPRRGSGKVGGMAYRLKHGERVDDGIRRIVGGRADQALQKLAAARSGAEFAEAIHSARKDMKKLRAVLRLVRGPLGKKLFRTDDHRYRDAARLLSQSRDAEVKLETLAALRKRFGAELPGSAASVWGELLEAERDQVAGAATGAVAARIEQAIATITAGRERISEWALRGDSWELVGPGLRRSYRQGRRELKRVRHAPSADNVHRWRKRVKDHWYQLRLVRKAWPQLLDETAERAHELADLLGDHHDLTVLAEDLAGRTDLASGEELAALIERRQGELLAAALALGARLFAEKPKAFGARIEAYWLAWRE